MNPTLPAHLTKAQGDPARFYRRFLRPILFRLDPERAHHLTLWALARLARRPSVARLWRRPVWNHATLHMHVAGLHFSTPVGLAAGFDKNAMAVGAFPALGFGAVEIGTVTPRPQAGNPPPRLFRLPADEAVINRMGFNNDGALLVAERLRASPVHIPVGVNLGKNAATPLDQALDDYRTCLEVLYDVGDYVVVNVSSPNTPGLRQLQSAANLSALLREMQACNQSLARDRQLLPRPLFVKIAPDLEPSALDTIVETVQACGLAGIIATNTTIARQGLSTITAEAGGLSGRPLRQCATEIIRYVYRRSQGSVIIIGVGGISSAADAYEKICAGASLVQLYTGLIYQGPGLPQRINCGLVRLLRRDGWAHLSQAVGCAAL